MNNLPVVNNYFESNYFESSCVEYNFENWRYLMVAHIDQLLPSALPLGKEVPSHLFEAMKYAIVGKGKRLRPLFSYAVGHCFNIDISALDVVACAIEMIHVYSLIHDDLPSMDDDNMRHGRATLHIAFDEATAVLVGDALQSQAYSVICNSILPAELKVKLIHELAYAAGAQGMVGGQMIDLKSVGHILNHAQIEAMHKMKTGALLSSALRMATYCKNFSNNETKVPTQLNASLALEGSNDAPNQKLLNSNSKDFIQNNITNEHMHALDCYAEKIGLAFQMIDDVLDVLGEDKTLGKTAGKDAKNNKPTFVTLLGVEKTICLARQLCKEAKAAINCFGQRRYYLLCLADLVVKRCQ